MMLFKIFEDAVKIFEGSLNYPVSNNYLKDLD